MRLELAALIVAGTILAGCSSSDSVSAEQTRPPSAAPSTEAIAPEPEPEPTPEAELNLPDGFPQVVAVSSLPNQVRNWYEMGGHEEAVAVAEGVWAELPPGATPEDAVLTLVFDGFCASKTAFEREYLDGFETAGTCW